MRQKYLQLVAILMAQFMIFIPISHSLGMSHDANPAVDVNETYARIEWRTDKNATSQVDFGTTQQLSPGMVDPVFRTDHAVELTGLTPNTRYYFQIVSIAEDGDYRIDNNYNAFYSFVTERFQDHAPPQISNVSLRDLTQTSALITWTTDEDATTEVFYGVENTSQQAVVPGYVKDHLSSIPAVEGNQYYYIVRSCDLAGNCINSSLFSFVGGADISAPTITTNIPRYDSNGVIDIIGFTERYSKVNLYINGVRRRTAPRSLVGASGEFRFRNVYLPQTDTEIKIEAIDQVGLSAEKIYTVTVDSAPPLLSITSIPSVTAATSVQIQGTVSEPSEITFQAVVDKDDAAPRRPQNLGASLGPSDAVLLSWDPVSATDAEEYAVYRNDIRIAVTDQTNYTDVGASENTDYAYRVSAVDFSCNEGSKSDSILVTVPVGAGTSLPITEDVELTCETRVSRISATGSFTHTLLLEGEGVNTITITAYDKAGNKDEDIETVIKDSAAPVIENHNLGGLQTVYSRTVRLKGKVSENATVLIYIDGETSPSESVLTEEDGTFEKDIIIHLAPDFTLEVSNLSVSVGTGTGWKHHVKMVARDIAGVDSAPVEGDIIFTFCGEGNWFTVTSATGDPLSAGITPDVLVPMLLRNGQAEMAFTINLSYEGQGEAKLIGKPSVRWAPQPVGQKGMDDREWFQNPRVRCSKDYKQCLVMIQANPVDPDPDTNLTDFEKDELISTHRQGECIYGVGGTVGNLFGCVKLAVIIEINFQETIPTQVPIGATPTTLSGGITESHVQKNCFDMNVMIDRRIPTDKVPEHFLKEMIRWSDNAIELIDDVLEPLEKIKKVVFYSCLTSWAALYMVGIWKAFKCDVSRFVQEIEGGGFEKAVAEVGKCEDVYTQDDEDDAKENCEKCTSAIKNYNRLKTLQRGLCDRIFCVSAPTLRKYIKDSKSKTLKEVAGTGWKSGPSCKLVGGENTKDVSLDDIEKVYSDYQAVEKQSGKLKDECSDPHPADLRCCGHEYMAEYGTVCGLGKELFYNELKESVCREKEAFNKPGKTLAGGGGGTINCHILGEIGEALGGVLDTFSSILRCEPGAKPVPTLVNTPFKYKPGIADRSDDKVVYYRIKQVKKDTDKPQVWMGYTTKAKGLNASAGNAVIHSTETFIAQEDVTNYFGPKGQETRSGLKGFISNLNGVALKPDKKKAESVYAEIRSKLGYNMQDILVDPTSGFLRTIQCLCLSGLTGYLKHYRTMLNMVRNCFAQILITGSGNEGVCEAVLSQVVCDLIYDVIACVTKLVPAFSKLGGERGGTFSDISSFVSALGTSASEVSADVGGRYGKSGMYQAMFNERKLINSICMWAFTGTWDANFESMLEADVGVTINSTGFIWPCDRRFITPNPTSNPPGLATWNYHIGIGFVAGADLRYNLKLKCSDDFSCDTSAGFAGGRCDCAGKGEQTRTVSGNVPGLGPGTLKKGESIGTEGTGNVYYKVEAPIRYDTGILEWSYKDNQGKTVQGNKECKISQVGAGAPAYCQFDLGAGMFRCGIGIVEEYWARFVQKPTPSYPVNTTGFSLEDPLSFMIDVQQKLPATQDCNDRHCAWTKYLTYVVKSHTGRVIANNTQELGQDPDLILNTDGEKIFAAPKGVNVGRHHFAPTAGAGTFNFRVLVGDPGIGPLTTPLTGLRGVSSNKYWIIEMDVQANNIIAYKVYTALKGTGPNNYTKGTRISSGQLTQTQNQITIKSGTVNVALLSFAAGGKPGHDTTALLSYTAPATQDTCNQYISSPAKWSVTFTLWDSEKLAGNIYQRSRIKTVDLTGAVQEHTVPFDVYCSAKAPAPVPAAPAPAVPSTLPSLEVTIPSLALKDIAVPTSAVGVSVNERGYEVRKFVPVNATVKFKNPPSYFTQFTNQDILVNPYIIVYGAEFYVPDGIDLKCTYGRDVECEIYVKDSIKSQIYDGDPENFTFAIRAFGLRDIYGLNQNTTEYAPIKVVG